MTDAPTPGPWRAGGNHVFAVTRDGLENWIASTDSPYVSATEPVANARLMAEAHTMLAALKAQHAALDALMATLVLADPTFMPSKSSVWPLIVQGQEAIKKAEDINV